MIKILAGNDTHYCSFEREDIDLSIIVVIREDHLEYKAQSWALMGDLTSLEDDYLESIGFETDRESFDINNSFIPFLLKADFDNIKEYLMSIEYYEIIPKKDISRLFVARLPGFDGRYELYIEFNGGTASVPFLDFADGIIAVRYLNDWLQTPNSHIDFPLN